MKLVELLQNQEIIIQLAWDVRKIEFYSKVIEKDETSIYVTPYIHNGAALELNIVSDSSVVCNVYTDDPATEQRIAWKGLSLTTVNRNNNTVYCLKAHSFNAVSNLEDRRLHERVAIQVDGSLADGEDEDICITIHDISDNGISFYVPGNYDPKSSQLKISFTDSIDEKIFDVHAVCTISRVNKEDGHTLLGCKVVEENDNYRIYELLKRLRKKNHIVTKAVETKTEEPKSEEKDNTTSEEK